MRRLVKVGSLNQGARFIRGGDEYIKNELTQFLYTSTLLSDIVNRGDCLATNLRDGRLYYVKGTSSVIELAASKEPNSFEKEYLCDFSNAYTAPKPDPYKDLREALSAGKQIVAKVRGEWVDFQSYWSFIMPVENYSILTPAVYSIDNRDIGGVLLKLSKAPALNDCIVIRNTTGGGLVLRYRSVSLEGWCDSTVENTIEDIVKNAINDRKMVTWKKLVASGYTTESFNTWSSNNG